MATYGVDVSYANWNALSTLEDWKILKNSKFGDFVILRRGYGVDPEEDDCFTDYYRMATRAGFTDISTYWFSYAISPEEAEIEAYNYLEMTRKDDVEIKTMILDFENNNKWAKCGYEITPEMADAHCKAFLDVLKNEGLSCAVYSSQWILEEILDWKSLDVAVWNAAYSQEDSIRAWMFQYTDEQEIPGLDGAFDANIRY